jgi:DNA-binding NtrC family response regulator
LPSELERKSSTKIGHTLKDEVVLVVDDEPFILLSMEAALQEAGARVYSAATALDALEILNRYQDISCVVTDYAMPGMTGAQLAAAIRVKKPRMPIIIASGYAEVPEEISQYPRLQKPFSANALLAVVVEATTPLKAEVIDFPLPNRTT